MKITIENGDNLELLKKYPDNYFSSIVTDCPYGLGKEPDAVKVLQDWIDHGYHEIKGKSGFMGKTWDAFVPQPRLWKEVLRVLKPGGHLFAFFGTRTYDWGTLAIRLAGFEIRDMITWHYAEGFPKSLNISKQIDKMNGVQGKKIGKGKAGRGMNPVKGFGISTTKNKSIKCCRNCGEELNKRKHGDYSYECISCDESFFEFETIDKEIFVEPKKEWDITEASSDQAKQWDGWGSALKPATEPICLARKPLDGTICNNVLSYGVGGININDCRVGFKDEEDLKAATYGTGTNIMGGNYVGSKLVSGRKNIEPNKLGRFPANVIFDEVMASALDDQSGELTSGNMDVVKKNNNNNVFGQYNPVCTFGYGDKGGASRFFYVAKATQDERNAGCEGLAKRQGGFKNDSGRGISERDPYADNEVYNHHPTIKPIALMRYLLRMVTPKGGIVLDPYAGSGTTGCAAHFEDIGEIILMDMEKDYIPIIEARTNYWSIEYNRRKYLEDLKDPEKQPENQLKMF